MHALESPTMNQCTMSMVSDIIGYPDRKQRSYPDPAGAVQHSLPWVPVPPRGPGYQQPWETEEGPERLPRALVSTPPPAGLAPSLFPLAPLYTCHVAHVLANGSRNSNT